MSVAAPAAAAPAAAGGAAEGKKEEKKKEEAKEESDDVQPIREIVFSSHSRRTWALACSIKRLCVGQSIQCNKWHQLIIFYLF